MYACNTEQWRNLSREETPWDVLILKILLASRRGKRRRMLLTRTFPFSYLCSRREKVSWDAFKASDSFSLHSCVTIVNYFRHCLGKAQRPPSKHCGQVLARRQPLTTTIDGYGTAADSFDNNRPPLKGKKWIFL